MKRAKLTAIIGSVAVIGGMLAMTTPTLAWWDIDTDTTTTIEQTTTEESTTTEPPKVDDPVIIPQGGGYENPTTTKPTTTEATTTTVLTTNPNTAPTSTGVTTSTLATTTSTTTSTTTTSSSTTTTTPTTTSTSSTVPEKKVWVCKFVGTPGVDEVLQTGQNPISVSTNAIPDPENDGVHVGDEFADAQGRSLVIAFDDGGPEPGVENCVSIPPTTTTTVVGSTTTTIVGVTTTTGVDTTTTTTTEPERKVWVCKFVGTPGVDERPQTGDNPISVSINSIPDPENDGVHVGDEFADAQGRSVVIAFDDGGPEPDISNNPLCQVIVPTTTTTTLPPTTTGAPTSTVVITPFAIEVEPLCPDGTVPLIAITFGNRLDLDGQTGTLTFSTGGSIQLVFDANNTVEIPYPASAGTDPVTMTYTLGTESVTRSTTFPEACAPGTTTTTEVPSTTTTTPPTTTESITTTTTPSTTTSTTSTSTTSPSSTSTTTTLPAIFEFGAAASVCVAEVPTIRINFLNRFPELAGEVGTLTMRDINGNVVSMQSLVYAPGTTVDLLYPGTSINPDGSIDDVPGWILTDDGFWIRDPSDEFLREGISLEYTVNPTATAFITYPPESSTCANPDGPFGPNVTPPLVPGQLPPTQ